MLQNSSIIPQFLKDLKDQHSFGLPAASCNLKFCIRFQLPKKDLTFLAVASSFVLPLELTH